MIITKMYSCMYTSLSIHVYTYIYIYIYMYVSIYRSLGVVSDKIASAKRNPVQTGNTTTTAPPTTTTTTTTTTNNNNGRCEGESQGKTRVLSSFLTIYMEQIEIYGAGESVTVVANPWVRQIPVSGVRFRFPSVRGPRSMAPCVARDRWHRAWPARDSGLFF